MHMSSSIGALTSMKTIGLRNLESVQELGQIITQANLNLKSNHKTQ